MYTSAIETLILQFRDEKKNLYLLNQTCGQARSQGRKSVSEYKSVS
jgi:hypothetical protein